ncbi:hypothetical protein [Candidatus Poriferisocius sp.]|uniref:hypothetical protein n=1 Tax=Candidatus Poriferisocius sp. TaxID=3101276 RepID=UPI003B521E1A
MPERRSQRVGIVRMVGRRTRLVRIGDYGVGWLDWSELIEAWTFRPLGSQSVRFTDKNLRRLKGSIRHWWEHTECPGWRLPDDAA